MQHDRNACLRNLPGGFRASETAANDVNGGEIVCVCHGPSHIAFAGGHQWASSIPKKQMASVAGGGATDAIWKDRIGRKPVSLSLSLGGGGLGDKPGLVGGGSSPGGIHSSKLQSEIFIERRSA
jgi:hypothetical protein